MLKVLVIQKRVRDYRIPVFNELAKKVDLSVIHCENRKLQNAEFKVIKIGINRIIFKWYKKSLRNFANQFDVVICMADISYPQFWVLSVFHRKYKFITWGIGVEAGYNQRYDGNQRTVKYLYQLIKRADAAIFYAEYPIEKYVSMGIAREKLFVANNTVAVVYSASGEKNTLLFIGTLYPQKRVDILIEQYREAYLIDNNLPELVIIGDGSEKQKLEEMVRGFGLTHKITFEGEIFDDVVLSKHFKNALICISPDQAGLSVLKSMGYGVPYVTHKNAITGGEIFNIHNGIDGILVDDFCELKEIFLDASSNKDKYIQMGYMAKKFYDENRTVDMMVKGFIDAIEYVTR